MFLAFSKKFVLWETKDGKRQETIVSIVLSIVFWTVFARAKSFRGGQMLIRGGFLQRKASVHEIFPNLVMYLKYQLWGRIHL